MVALTGRARNDIYARLTSNNLDGEAHPMSACAASSQAFCEKGHSFGEGHRGGLHLESQGWTRVRRRRAAAARSQRI
eukprot:6186699-Pleurochrysis_carterae.AAC.2